MNYEEYLLLYIDGELSPEEKQSVDAFLQVNPDLKEEMELLQQTVLHPEESFTFSGKDMLYKKEEGINHSNYREYFLLYVDEELDKPQKDSVETFVLQNPELQDEFTLLKQTVLPKETIIFKNKEVLYKKEEKRRPVVISIRWASLAAAVMMGIIAMLWVFNSNKPTTLNPVADNGAKKKVITIPVTDQPAKTLPVQQGDNNIIAVENNNIRKAGLPVATNQVQQKNIQPQQNTVTSNTLQPQQIAVVEPGMVAVNPNTHSISTNTQVNSYTENDNKVTNTGTPDVADNNYVQPAVYKQELNTEEENNNKNLYVGALQVNPEKVRGFFRKAGRFLSSKLKNNNDEDGKVQIANLEVNKLK